MRRICLRGSMHAAICHRATPEQSVLLRESELHHEDGHSAAAPRMSMRETSHPHERYEHHDRLGMPGRGSTSRFRLPIAGSIHRRS